MPESKAIRLYTIALAAVLLYGLSPIFTKIAVATADGVTVGALRAIVAAPLAVAAIVMGRLPLPWHGHDKWLLLLSGAFALAGFPILFSWGVQLTTAGHAAAASASGAVMGHGDTGQRFVNTPVYIASADHFRRGPETHHHAVETGRSSRSRFPRHTRAVGCR